MLILDLWFCESLLSRALNTYETIYLLKTIVPLYLWATTNHFVYAIAADFICISAWQFCKLAYRLCDVSLKWSNIMDGHFKKKVWFKKIALFKGNHWQWQG